MSKLIVEVCAIEEIAPIEGADRIERCRIKNWWSVSGKGQYKVGDKVVYVPPNAVLPEELAERWGIAKFCQPIKHNNVSGYRVLACRFKGVASCGTIQPLEDPDWPVGHSVAEHYGVTKYDPPAGYISGDCAYPIDDFHKYTDIENICNFPNILVAGEEVVVTEKLHGMNCRVGYVVTGESEGQAEIWEFMAGSHSVRLKEVNQKGQRSVFWKPLSTESTNCPLRKMIVDIWMQKDARNSVIVFGELIGPGSQDMHYGQEEITFRGFDISVDRDYLDHDEAKAFFDKAGIATVPVLYRGPFSMSKLDELVDGPTTVCEAADINQPFKGREGIVVKPIKERHDGILGGRVVFKYISVDYESRRNKDRTEDH